MIYIYGLMIFCAFLFVKYTVRGIRAYAHHDKEAIERIDVCEQFVPSLLACMLYCICLGHYNSDQKIEATYFAVAMGVVIVICQTILTFLYGSEKAFLIVNIYIVVPVMMGGTSPAYHAHLLLAAISAGIELTAWIVYNIKHPENRWKWLDKMTDRLAGIIICFFRLAEKTRAWAMSNAREKRAFGLCLWVISGVSAIISWKNGWATATDLLSIICIISFFILNLADIDEAISSVRRFLSFLAVKLLCLTYLILLVVLVAADRWLHLEISLNWFTYILCISIYALMWHFCSLVVDSKVSRVSNSVFSASLSTLTAIANIVFLALPETLYLMGDAFPTSSIRFVFNLMTFPFIFISATTVAVVNLRDYWKEKQ